MASSGIHIVVVVDPPPHSHTRSCTYFELFKWCGIVSVVIVVHTHTHSHTYALTHTHTTHTQYRYFETYWRCGISVVVTSVVVVEPYFAVEPPATDLFAVEPRATELRSCSFHLSVVLSAGLSICDLCVLRKSPSFSLLALLWGPSYHETSWAVWDVMQFLVVILFSLYSVECCVTYIYMIVPSFPYSNPLNLVHHKHASHHMHHCLLDRQTHIFPFISF